MYNHYIPQSDGSFRRNSVADHNRGQHSRPSPPPQRKTQQEQNREPTVSIPEASPSESKQHNPQREQHNPQPDHNAQRQESSPLSFLRKLLPKDMDSADLIIIVLLLLLSSEDCDGDTAPLLTLALYFLL